MSRRELNERLELLEARISESADVDRLRRLAVEGDAKASKELYRQLLRLGHSIEASGVISQKYHHHREMIRTIRSDTRYLGRQAGYVRFAASEGWAKKLANEGSVTLVRVGKTRDNMPIWMSDLRRTGSRFEVDVAFEMLANALKGRKLPTERGAPRQAATGEFMYMGKTKAGRYSYKHDYTRNYVYIDPKNGQLLVPQTNRPFQLGYFDARG